MSSADETFGPSRQPGSASDSFIGYVYQAELALLELTRRRIESPNPSWAVTIEVFDDVAFQRDASPEEFLQAKHSLRSTRQLTDTSPDLWKTLRNWSTLVATGVANPRESTFTLWSTQPASPLSAAELLREEDRDPDRALERLLVAARTSESQANKPAYQAFLALNPDDRLSLVEAIVVVDGSPTITAIDQELRKLVWAAATPARQMALVRRLREWWYGRVRAHLLEEDDGRIESLELDLALEDLREQLIGESLPLDVSTDDPRLEDLSVEDRLFVQQLSLILCEYQPLALAIRDYKRAYLQRSLWLDDELLTLGDLRRYEDTLIDEWEHYKAFTHGGTYDSEDEMVRAGMELYLTIQKLQVSIHESRNEAFICRGSYHMLADELRVGWHPEFVALLRGVLSGDESP